MKTEDWNLLKRDLCARLPYGVIIQVPELFYATDVKLDAIFEVDDDFRFTKSFGYLIENVKPYLRPMSSMTEEERHEYNMHLLGITTGVDAMNFMIWIYQHHLDILHFIEKGLALEAPENMYNIK